MKLFSTIITMVSLVLVFFVSCGGEGTSCSGNFPNEHDGKCWADLGPNFYSWQEAKTYCEEKGGRLPTLTELRTLIQNCPATENGGACGVTENCLDSTCRNDACKGCQEDNTSKYSILSNSSHLFHFSADAIKDDNTKYWGVGFTKASIGYVENKENLKGSMRCIEK